MKSPEAMTVELGAFGGVFFPSDRHELYDSAFEHREFESPVPQFGARLGFYPLRYLGIEVEGAGLPISIRGGGDAAGYAARGHLVAQWPDRLTPFVVVGGGALGLDSDDEVLGRDLDGAFHWGLGAKGYLTEFISVRLDGRHLFTASLDDPGQRADRSATSHFELLFGVGFTFPRSSRVPPDPDLDGFRGDRDRCPDQKGIAPDGCPRDSDGDGVMDAVDACPQLAGGEADGCPIADADSDAVPDADDACPGQPGSTDAKGCPDRDRDGVPDGDACPDRPGGAPHGCPRSDPDGDGVIGDEDRCPEKVGPWPRGCPDTDGDGVDDADDTCPESLETENGFDDFDGCPDEVPEAVARLMGPVAGVIFPVGGIRIRKKVSHILDGAVEVLEAFPSLRLGIQGHTDNTGDRTLNRRISQARADAVKRYLVARGIDESRLFAEGFGPDRPIETNKTAAGRSRNRRIEFRLIN